MVALGSQSRLRRLLRLVAVLDFTLKPFVASESLCLLRVGKRPACLHGGPDRAFAAHVRLC